jgi:hypothetical protein
MTALLRASAADERAVLDYEQIFGNDSGEDEKPEVLASYFVELQSFQKAYDTSQRIGIIRARKGMGKSALLSHLEYRLLDPLRPLDPGAIAIRLTGNELIGLADFSGIDSSLMENRWKQVICKRISMEIGKSIGFAISDDSMTLVEIAEIEGFKGRNLVSSLLRRIGSAAGETVKRLSAGVVTLPLPSTPDSRQLDFARVLERVQNQAERNVWLLVDDIDAKFVDNPEQHCRIGAFFSAIRSLAHAVEGLRVRASVRTDVWTNLRCMEDQDKLRQYTIDIRWSDDLLKRIFARRILSYLQRDGDGAYACWNEVSDYDRITSQIFDGNFRIGPDRRSEPLNVAIALAGKRPRWMGQLCKLAGGAAGYALIQQRHFNEVMGSFGKEKISDLIKEHIHQFADLQKIIDAFRRSDKQCNRFRLLTLLDKGYVSRKAARTIPDVNGFPFKTSDQLARLLFEIDFIVGVDKSKVVPYHDDPTLFESEPNLQNRICWSVNLSYRSFLNIQQ